MAANWPSSPTPGQLYAIDQRIWQWNGEGWERVFNAGQTVSVFIAAGPFVELALVAFPQAAPQFTLLNYI